MKQELLIILPRNFKMNKLFLAILVLLIINLFPSGVWAKTTTPASELKDNRQQQIEELRQRVATKAAELREQMKRVITGDIKSINDTTIVITTKNGDKTVLTDENTTFIRLGAGGRQKITLDDLAVGNTISVFGQLDQDSGKITAKIIIAKVIPLNIDGKVSAVDLNDGTITVQTPKKGLFIVDVETYTKILIWEKSKGMQKLGFSKIKVDDRVHVNGTVPAKPKAGENRLSANRILVLPGKAVGIVGSPTPSSTPLPSPTATPSATPEI